MNTPIIIGAGISGLSAANHLVDHGIYPIIIEPDEIGRNKVCGEFFSCEAIPYLNKWEIPHITIKKASFNTRDNKLSFKLPVPAASTSRSICELELSKRALKMGAQFITGTFVQNIIPTNLESDLHYIVLSSGQILETNKLIITTSKLPLSKTKKNIEPNYIGIKAHFINFEIPNELNMYFSDGSYMGLTLINNETINVCCLAKKEIVDKYESISSFMNSLFSLYSSLNKLYKSAKQLSEDWLTIRIGNFGKKNIPDWANAYFIGDAIATIHPASGNGLAMGLTSGVMAAEHIINNSQAEFKISWNLRYQNRMNYARLLHYVFMSERNANIGFKISNLFPWMIDLGYKFTRDYY